MKKIIPILILIVGSTITIIFIFFRPDFSPEEVEEEVSTVKIDDRIRKKIDGLSGKDKAYYYKTKSYIEAFYHKQGKDGTSEEDIALKELDLEYLKVLNKETEKIVDICFSGDDSLKSEVDSFYFIYGSESDPIRKAKDWFYTKLKIENLPYKVKQLLREKFNEKKYNNLTNKISTLKRSDHHIKIKKCNKLLKIINDADTQLDDFSQVRMRYDNFKGTYLEKKEDWEYHGEVAPGLIDNFKNYSWYNNQVVILDRKLELGKKIRNLTNEINFGRLDEERLQEKGDELNELKNELEELLPKLELFLNKIK